MVHIARELSPALMWVAMTIVVAFCFLGGAALIGWLPMQATPQVSEETGPPVQGGKSKHATALALRNASLTSLTTRQN